MRNFHKIDRSMIYSLNGIAASSHPLATLEAISILKQGGNAIDAAIAANVVLAVVEPQSTGIGGDCFALLHLKGNEKPIAINGSGKAASYANPSYFKEKNITNIDINSVHSITIPGCIDAWSTMSKKWGKLPWNELFKTAISYAKNGFVVMERVAFDWEKSKKWLQTNKNTKETFLKANGEVFKTGDVFKNPNLAKTLEKIANEGGQAFYTGDIAKDIVTSLEKVGGLHNLEDFKNQDTIISDAISVNYRDKTLYQCPPNNQGITALIIMKILEKFNISKFPAMSFERFHLEAETTKLAYHIRDQIVSDDITKIDYDKYINDEYLDKLRDTIKFDRCLDPLDSNLEKVFSPDTVYMTIIDKDQNAISFINSIFHAFGSGITTDQTGIILHNRGACFQLKNNHPNCINSGKRPLHTIMPGMIYKKGKFLVSYGVVGGQYQPVGHVQFLNNYLEYNMDIQQALNFPRAFHFGKVFQLEERVDKEIEEKLKFVGHIIERDETPLGGAQAVGVNLDNGVFFGGSDPRKDGCAMGY